MINSTYQLSNTNHKSLTITNLSYNRGERDLFNNLEFKLNSGEILQIAGVNGCGKTSLLRIISGLTSCETGTISWNNIDIFATDYQQNFIYLGHQTGVKNQLTAIENLQFAQQLKNHNKADLFNVLQQLSLAGFEDIPVFQLSTGQKRLVGLARLLVSNCPLWILDEPFTALDKYGVIELEKIFQQHLTNNGMVIFTSHQPLPTLTCRVLNLADFTH